MFNTFNKRWGFVSTHVFCISNDTIRRWTNNIVVLVKQISLLGMLISDVFSYRNCFLNSIHIEVFADNTFIIHQFKDYKSYRIAFEENKQTNRHTNKQTNKQTNLFVFDRHIFY